MIVIFHTLYKQLLSLPWAKPYHPPAPCASIKLVYTPMLVIMPPITTESNIFSLMSNMYDSLLYE